MALFNSHKVINGELCISGECQTFQTYHSVVGGREPKVYTLIKSKTRNESVLMIHVCTQWANTVG